MAERAKKKATYEDLCALPETLVGEIIDEELIATPRPSPLHCVATSALGGEVISPLSVRQGRPRRMADRGRTGVAPRSSRPGPGYRRLEDRENAFPARGELVFGSSGLGV